MADAGAAGSRKRKRKAKFAGGQKPKRARGAGGFSYNACGVLVSCDIKREKLCIPEVLDLFSEYEHLLEEDGAGERGEGDAVRERGEGGATSLADALGKELQEIQVRRSVPSRVMHSLPDAILCRAAEACAGAPSTLESPDSSSFATCPRATRRRGTSAQRMPMVR